jgi:hypothetical protein
MPQKINEETQSFWPSLPYKDWQETLDTLHLLTQIVGKIKLKQNPFLNQWWEVAFFVTSQGITTGRIPYKNSSFEISFNFIFHKLIIKTSKGAEKIIPLKSMSVSDFYEEVINSLQNLHINVTINTIPSEMPGFNTPFDKDNKHISYDREYVEKWHWVLLQTSFILDKFRSNFRGKSSPVHFFWGSFDLNTARFSGKKLPDKTDWPKGYHFMRFAENEENFSCGFWPGNKKFPKPAFYSYVYPTPAGCEMIKTGSTFSFFDKSLAECVFPYEDARKTKNPEKEILKFFNTTYREFAKLAQWNIKELEGITP